MVAQHRDAWHIDADELPDEDVDLFLGTEPGQVAGEQQHVGALRQFQERRTQRVA